MREYFPKDELFEKLAAIEHERWADWQRYCFEKLKIYNEGAFISPDAEETIIQRWFRQMNTPYEDLTEQEKDSDREQVMRYWHLIK
jgi:hypothetical protein